MLSQTQDDTLVTGLFDAMPESVIWFLPVYSGLTIVDFEVAYCNNSASHFLHTNVKNLNGQRILTTNLVEDDYKKTLFTQCLQVWLTGNPQKENFYSKQLNRYFSAIRSKAMGGVISLTRDKTEENIAEKKRLEQARLYNCILDASADGIMMLEAVRDKNYEVIDFKIAHCNKAGFLHTKLSQDDIGRTLLQALPHLADSRQFQLHKEVLETGVVARLETTFRDRNGREYGWFIVSLMKLEDGVVSSFVDILEKKNNEQKIEEQADLLNSIFDASANAVVACEAIRNVKGEIIDLQILRVNEGFCRLWGKKPVIAEGSTYLSLFPKAKNYPFYSRYCEVIETGKSIRTELYYAGEENKGWYDVSAVKRGSNGVAITFSDITQSKLAKESVEKVSQTLQQVIDNSQTGIILLTPVVDTGGKLADFRFKTVNQTLASYTGLRSAEIAGKLYSEIFSGPENAELFLIFKNIHSGSEPEQRFQNFYRYGNSSAWFDISVKKLEDDLLVTLLDYTPLQKLQTEMAAVADKLNTVINSSLTGIFTLQPVFSEGGTIEDFRFGIVNEAVAAYIGNKAANLRGALASVYFPAYKTNGLFETYRDSYLNNNRCLFDFHYRGNKDWYFSIHAVKSGDEVLVTFTDHTNLKTLQFELQSSVAELKNSNANLEEFAYAASHDLQEPLRKIHYFSERLKKVAADRLTPEESGMFERMEKASKRMTTLIDDLLIYSQINAASNDFKNIDLNSILHQVLADLESTIAEKHAIIHAGELPSINGDATQLSQLFLNLISNSLKYSKKSTAPVIHITCRQVVKTTNGETKAYCSISVSDNGIGFGQEHSEKIFKVFQRLHGQNEFPGTGIGLAIVYKVIQSHNGFISAEGRKGEGATFTILLPAT